MQEIDAAWREFFHTYSSFREGFDVSPNSPMGMPATLVGCDIWSASLPQGSPECIVRDMGFSASHESRHVAAQSQCGSTERWLHMHDWTAKT